MPKTNLMPRSLLSYIFIAIKGMAMGAADVVPGVSGGTIAFVSGIYEELLTTIDGLNLGIFSTWKKKGFKEMWASYNLGFLASLFLGIFISVLSLAKAISYVLEVYPIPTWSFFFGLVVASVLYIGKQIKKWSPLLVIVLLLGGAVAYYITIAASVEAPDAIYFFFLSGCIAIIAMILPGISGSFILVILGAYAMVLGALNDFISSLLEQDWEGVKSNFIRVFVFILGCLVGIKIFSKALKWMFNHKKELTLAILTGFMMGSLNKIWPWKKILSTRIDRHGKEQIVQADSILPGTFDGDPQLAMAILFALIGFALIFLLERFATRKTIYANGN